MPGIELQLCSEQKQNEQKIIGKITLANSLHMRKLEPGIPEKTLKK